MSYVCQLTELSLRYEKALAELRAFKDACVGVLNEKSEYKTNGALLDLIPGLTRVYMEYNEEFVKENLTENEFY